MSNRQSTCIRSGCRMVQSLQETSIVRVPETTHSDLGAVLSPAKKREQSSFCVPDHNQIPVANINPSNRENNVTREITSATSGSNLPQLIRRRIQVAMQ